MVVLSAGQPQELLPDLLSAPTSSFHPYFSTTCTFGLKLYFLLFLLVPPIYKIKTPKDIGASCFWFLPHR